MDRLKVLFITAWYPTAQQPVGGVFVREHAKAVQRYDDVTVLHLAGRKPGLRGVWQLEQEQDTTLTEGIATYRLWVKDSVIPKSAYLLTLWALPKALRRLKDVHGDPDILHAHVYTAAAAAALATRGWRTPMVVTEHWSAFPQRLLSPVDVRLARIGFSSAKLVMPVSHALQQSIESYGIRVPFKVVPNVVNVDLFHPSDRLTHDPREKRLLFVGLLNPSHIKGVPYLLQALSDLRRRRVDWHLDIVGDGPARAQYQQTAADLGIGDKVTFHGLKSKMAVAEFMKRADIFVLPTTWETFGCVLVEAMASGLPILSTSVGAVPEIVDDSVGILVPPKDVGALCRGLDRLLDSFTEFDRSLIMNRARQFSPDRVGHVLDGIYRRFAPQKASEEATQ